VGTGHLYRGRFKSFPVAQDDHFLRLCRYVERNALRAGLVQRAESWRWSSLWRRQQGPQPGAALLSDWPVPRPADWVREVNRPQTEAELEALRRCVQRGQPYGQEGWAKRVAQRLGLESTLRPRKRARETSIKGS
jgi:putative transposase